MSNLEDVKNLEEELNIIKRISNQLAQPSYAGYPTCVNKKDYYVSLKTVPTEQIEVLLDEYSTEFGGRLTNVIEEMKSVENILLDELFFGESGILFSVIGEIGIGKTSLLLHLNWKINYMNEYIYKLFLDQDDTWSYWNLHNTLDGNPLSVNRYGNRTWVWDNDFVPCTPKRLVGIYVQAIDLLPFLRDNQDIFDIKDIIEASYTTYVHRDTSIDPAHVSHSDYVSAYTTIIQKDNPTAVFLFVDSLDLIQDRNSRVSLIQQLNETVQDPASNVFRVFFSSRNYALFKMKDIPDNTIFLYLEKLDEERAEKLCYYISPNLDDYMKNPLQKKTFKRIMRHCSSPYIALLTTKLIEEGVSLPPTLFSFYELLLNKLESKSTNEHSMNTSKYQIGISKVSSSYFNDLVGLVAYFALCWLPMSWDQKWSTKDKFQKIISLLLKKYPISFSKTSIGFIYKEYVNHHKDSGFTDKQIIDMVAKAIWNSIASHFVDAHLARLHFKQSLDNSSPVEDEDVNDIQILDLPLLQFLVANFLTQSNLSEPLLNTINSLEETSPDISSVFPNLFSWRRESILTDHCWENVYDLICSKKGISFTSELILQHKQTLVDFLNDFKASKGIDPQDLGQIRFYRFIKGFALEIEDQQLYNLMYPKNRKQNLFIESLQDLFGRSLVTAIEYNSTAIIHLEKRTTFILETFSKSSLKMLIKIMVDILFKGTMASITDLLNRMDAINLIDENTIAKIVDFVGNPKEGAILKPAVRFLSSRAQNYRHVRVFIENLAIKDHEILEESINAISKIAKQSLGDVLNDFQKLFQNHDIYEEIEDKELVPYYRLKDHPNKRIHFIYNYHDWNLLFRTSISLLMDLIRLGFLHSTKNLSYYEKSYEPKARLIQSKKVSTLIKMMESDSPGTRLFAFILLGSIDRTNMYDKEEENKNIDAQIIILNSLCEAYKPTRKIPSDLGIKGLNYIILDLLGEEAMYYSTKLDNLVKSKHDLLFALNMWAFSLINVEKKRTICHTLLQHRNYRVQRDIIQMMSTDKQYLENANPADLSAIITHGLIKRDSRFSIQKLSLQFLNSSLLYSNNQTYRIHCIDQIMSLFSRFGYFEAFISETLLKTIDVLLSSEMKEDDKQEIVSFLKKKEFHIKIIKSFRSQGNTVNKILIGKIYRHFIRNDDPSILDYVLILADIPSLRYLALEQLKYIDVSLAPALIEMATSQLMRHEDTILRSTYSVLLGNMGLRESLRPLVIDKALELILKSNNDSVCMTQGLKILSIVGYRCNDFPNVCATIEALLKSLEAHILSEQALSSTEIELAQGLCQCIERMRLYSDDIIFSLINILNNINDNGIMNSVFLVIGKLVWLIPNKTKFEDSLFSLLNNPNSLVRELGIRIIRKFGSSTVKHSVSRLVKLISDPEPFPRKQALKSISYLMKNGDDRVRRDALLLVPAIVSALEDKNPMVVIEALEALRAFKSRRRNVSKTFDHIRPSSPILDTDSDSSGQIDVSQFPRSLSKEGLKKSKRHNQSIEDDDSSTFFINKVVKPNLDRIIAILHRKRYRMHTGVRVTVFLLLCESKCLTNYISHFEELFNSEDTNMLYEIGEVFKKLGQSFLQYIGTVMSILKPSNPLIRSIARIIAKHEKKIDYAFSSKIFDTQTIITLAKSKDSNVRRIAVNLLGKKVLEKPKSLWALIQMWSDKVYKVRKEVMEVLGDIGRRNPKIIPMIMDAIDTESMNSVLIWRYLSKSWGILIKSSTNDDDTSEENESSSS